jgi:sigma54-dependent transcription regulator
MGSSFTTILTSSTSVTVDAAGARAARFSADRSASTIAALSRHLHDDDASSIHHSQGSDQNRLVIDRSIEHVLDICREVVRMIDTIDDRSWLHH